MTVATRIEIFLGFSVLRRLVLASGLMALGLSPTPAGSEMLPALVVLATVGLLNEQGRRIARRPSGGRLAAIAAAQALVDTVALALLLAEHGSTFRGAEVALLVPLSLSWATVLPLPHALGVLVATTVGLDALGAAWPLTAANVLTVLVCQSLALRLRRRTPRGERPMSGDERRVRALLEVAEHATRLRSVDELLPAVCGTLVALPRVVWAQVFLWDASRGTLALAASRETLGHAGATEATALVSEAAAIQRLRDGEVLYASPRTPEERHELVVVPMRSGSWFEGALAIGWSDTDSTEATTVAEGIARQATLGLVNVRATEQRLEDAEVSRVLLNLSEALNACLDEEPLWDTVTRRGPKMLGLSWAVALRFDDRETAFTVVGTHGVADPQLVGSQVRLEDVPLLQELLASRAIVTGDDARVAPLAPIECWGGGAQWTAIPFVRSGLILGALVAGGVDSEHRLPARRARRLAEGLAHHAMIALQNARLVTDLEATDRLKTEFVSTMSHELRTPLNVMLGYTEMLRDGAAGALSEEQLDMVGRLDSRSRELLHLVEATLYVGRLEAGIDIMQIEPTTLEELVGSLLASTSGLPRRDGVRLEWDTPTVLTPAVLIDSAKLALIVRNLVGNALKFTHAGHVRVRLTLGAEGLLVEVSDTGIGIPPEQLPVIFEMFRQVDGSERRRHDGVGLGLYIVRQFAARLGGTVDVESEAGRGSTFRVRLPDVRPVGQEHAA